MINTMSKAQQIERLWEVDIRNDTTHCFMKQHPEQPTPHPPFLHLPEVGSDELFPVVHVLLHGFDFLALLSFSFCQLLDKVSQLLLPPLHQLHDAAQVLRVLGKTTRVYDAFHKLFAFNLKIALHALAYSVYKLNYTIQSKKAV